MEDPRKDRFDHQKIEAKWQKVWAQTSLDVVDIESAKRPFYNLMMFPYPSAEGLHVGNMYAFTGSDVYGRFKRMQGYDVFEPIGLDGFGIHSENFALKIGRHPMDHARITQTHFYDQLHKIGAMLDFTRTLETYDPSYYRWTQWLFVQMFKAGLAYRAKAEVNFCPSCKTVLADEQVIDNACERCGNAVEKRALEQWFFRITAYAEKLLGNISKLKWAEVVKTAQTNWIGKKEGISISYPVVTEDGQEAGELSCFTTRPDTNFGATFVVIAPEHEFVERVISHFSPSDVLASLSDTPSSVVHRPHTNLTQDNRGVGKQRAGLRALDGDPQMRNNPSLVKEIQEYVASAKQKSEADRVAEGRKKTGVNTGLYCVNKLNNERMPLYISDFVLAGFGTGAVVGVPGHDIRDFQFAKVFDLPVKRVVASKDGDTSSIIKEEQVQEDDGVMVNSGFLDGLDIHEATEKMMDYLEEKGWGKRVVTYHLRDWLISRQRYWGPPIPMIYCEHCASEGKGWFNQKTRKTQRVRKIGQSENQKVRLSDISENPILRYSESSEFSELMHGWFPVPEDQLPVLLPRIEDYKPSSDGVAPLSKHKEFFDVVCPCCGKSAVRETDVSDTFLDSSWYFLRYPSMKNSENSENSESQKTLKTQRVRFSNISDTQILRNSEYSESSEHLPWDPQVTRRWLPVNMYTGGAEHSVLHLLYSRYITMVLHDLEYLDFEEPFANFFAHGLVVKDGAKMSKSKGNVVNPDEYIETYGADAIRLYLMFMGPFSMGGDFRDTGMEGMSKWVSRVWRIIVKSLENSNCHPERSEGSRRDSSPSTLLGIRMTSKRNIPHLLDKTIAKLTDDMEKRRYNTAIACLMEFTNAVMDAGGVLEKEALKKFVLLLAPFAPHLSEEAWNLVHGRETYTDPKYSIHRQPWPSYDPKNLEEKEVSIIVQVNGKVRTTLTVTPNEAKNQQIVEEKAKMSAKLETYLSNGVKKTIFIPGKLINFVVSF